MTTTPAESQSSPPANVLGRVVATSLGTVHGLHEHLGKLESDASVEDALDLDSARVFLEAVNWRLIEVLGRHGLPLVEGSADAAEQEPVKSGAAAGGVVTSRPFNVLERVVDLSLRYVQWLHEQLGNLEGDASPEDGHDLAAARAYLEAVHWKLAEVLGRHGIALMSTDRDGAADSVEGGRGESDADAVEPGAPASTT